MSKEQLSCRFCNAPLVRSFLDLGRMPLANSYLRPEDLERPEPAYPLHARLCDRCFLVQVDKVVPPSVIFEDYAYFSSYSDSWVEQARAYASAMKERLSLGSKSQVIEIASNDGYLLRHFVASGVPVLGIEPAANVAAAAKKKGVATRTTFFDLDTAQQLRAEGYAADLMVANNVLAHVPNLNDFVAGLSVLLKPDGLLTVEVPHLLNLIEDVQFDTIYHEHFCYFSVSVIERVFSAHGLRIFDVEELSSHGGSLRIFVCHTNSATHIPGSGLTHIRDRERAAGLENATTYEGFPTRVEKIRDDLVSFLGKAAAKGQVAVAYGAAAKGNTLLNYCGIGPNLLAYVVDRNPTKQGRFLPGSHLPIFPPGKINETRPDWILILPWNLRDEISMTLTDVKDWGGRLVTAIPSLRLFDPPA